MRVATTLHLSIKKHPSEEGPIPWGVEAFLFSLFLQPTHLNTVTKGCWPSSTDKNVLGKT